jgi:hypothetical protein
MSLVIALNFITSCDETKEIPEETVDNIKTVDESDYKKSVLPSIIGYIFETKNGIAEVISQELKSDDKSTFAALVIKLASGEVMSVNFHFKGEYNQTELSLNHPFIVICESDGDCKNCGFKTTDVGVECACAEKGKSSPCMLTIDHITDFDFYENYHSIGLELVDEYIK